MKKGTSSKKSSKRAKKRNQQKVKRYSRAQKMKILELYLEKSIPASEIAEKFRISTSAIYRWARKYSRKGAEGLSDDRPRNTSRAIRSQGIKKTVIEIKKENPGYGSRRISDMLKRFFGLPGSPETVRKTLHEEKLVPPKPRKKPKRKKKPPRRFERARPNQMWQSDIHQYQIGRNIQEFKHRPRLHKRK